MDKTDQFNPPKVLIVDDDTKIRKIIHHFLTQEGYNVIEAKDGQEAIDYANAQKPDVILLDIMIPKIDGLMVCKLLKSSVITRGTTIIMLTSRAREIDILNSIKAGADDFVVKPFTKQTILTKVRLVSATKDNPPALKERRNSPRKPLGITITWKEKLSGETKVSYKERVIDISVKGLSIEHRRCDVCTGYEKGTVHPLCPFSSYARRFKTSEPLELIITFADETIFVVKGKVVHVFQPNAWPTLEKVGVEFFDLPKNVEAKISELPVK